MLAEIQGRDQFERRFLDLNICCDELTVIAADVVFAPAPEQMTTVSEAWKTDEICNQRRKFKLSRIEFKRFDGGNGLVCLSFCDQFRKTD